ncbi:MAG: ATP-binding protein [Erysipelotrichaceae bacterium]
MWFQHAFLLKQMLYPWSLAIGLYLLVSAWIALFLQTNASLLVFAFGLIAIVSLVWIRLASYQHYLILQQLIQSIILLLSTSIVVTILELVSQQNSYQWLERPSYFSILVLCVVVMYALLYHSFHKHWKTIPQRFIDQNTPLWMFVGFFLLWVIKLVCFVLILLHTNHTSLVSMLLLLSSLLDLGFGFVLYQAIKQGYATSLYKHKSETLELQSRFYQESLAVSKSKATKINRLTHDAHHHNLVLQHYLESNNIAAALSYLQIHTQKLKSKQTLCDHEMINALLQHNQQLCESLALPFQVDVRLPYSLSICDFDLCVILGNLLDNAREAAHACLDAEAFIQCRSFIRHDSFVLELQNSFAHTLKPHHNTFLSTKADSIAHGFGLTHVQSIVDAHRGSLSLRAKNNEFHVLLILPLNN